MTKNTKDNEKDGRQTWCRIEPDIDTGWKMCCKSWTRNTTKQVDWPFETFCLDHVPKLVDSINLIQSSTRNRHGKKTTFFLRNLCDAMGYCCRQKQHHTWVSKPKRKKINNHICLGLKIYIVSEYDALGSLYQKSHYHTIDVSTYSTKYHFQREPLSFFLPLTHTYTRSLASSQPHTLSR